MWDNEAHDFTTGLAEEKKLGLLSKRLGTPIELEAKEQDIGPFRADILCKTWKVTLGCQLKIKSLNPTGRGER